ncbi:MAG TPA: FAD-binding oxidoreductase [Roseomonas sp.]|nr:FAD-binding oxidoreductase [Roseomonas sp.]
MPEDGLPNGLPAGLRERLRACLGPKGMVEEADDIAPHLSDWRGLYHGRTPCVLRPASTAELSAVVALCHAAGVAMVPQGGNTSMSGGSVPDGSGRQVVVSLGRMNRLRALDPVDMTMTVEAGMVVRRVQELAAEAGCQFPLAFGGDGTAMVGGMLSTNAGGNTTVRYGNARELTLGLEVVLPDGQVIDALRQLRKDNTGYALRQLFIGAEGTLGFITAAVLRLFPPVRDKALALCAVQEPEAALALFRRFRDRDETALRAFEYISGSAMRLVLEGIEGASLPLASPAPHYVLIDLAASRPQAGLRELLEGVLEEALEAGEVADAVIAESEAQRQAIWRLREEAPEAQRRAGASVKSDVSVPVSRVPELIRRCFEAMPAIVPGAEPVAIGHLGDGNIHMNLQQPAHLSAEAFMAHGEAVMNAVNEITGALGGSFSAEHGVGRIKVKTLAKWRGGAELETMRRIRAALDPAGLMNPDVLFAPAPRR